MQRANQDQNNGEYQNNPENMFPPLPQAAPEALMRDDDLTQEALWSMTGGVAPGAEDDLGLATAMSLSLSSALESKESLDISTPELKTRNESVKIVEILGMHNPEVDTEQLVSNPELLQLAEQEQKKLKEAFNQELLSFYTYNDDNIERKETRDNTAVLSTSWECNLKNFSNSEERCKKIRVLQLTLTGNLKANDELFERLQSILPNCVMLEKLSLSREAEYGAFYSVYEWEKIGALLSVMPNLRVLELRDCLGKLHKESYYSLKNPNVTLYNINDRFQACYDAILKCPQLEVLDLSNNPISEDVKHFEGLGVTLSRLPKLRTLILKAVFGWPLYNKPPSDSLIQAYYNAVFRCLQLEHLDLSDNFIGENAKYLKDLLSQLPNLRTLILENVFHGSKKKANNTWREFCAALSSAAMLERINLSRIANDASNWEQLGNAFSTLRHLRSLELTDCLSNTLETTNDEFQACYDAIISGCPQLESLNLSYNCIAENAERCNGLGVMLSRLPNLKRLILQHIYIDVAFENVRENKEFHAFCDALSKGLTSLQELNLKKNKLGRKENSSRHTLNLNSQEKLCAVLEGSKTLFRIDGIKKLIMPYLLSAYRDESPPAERIKIGERLANITNSIIMSRYIDGFCSNLRETSFPTVIQKLIFYYSVPGAEFVSCAEFIPCTKNLTKSVVHDEVEETKVCGESNTVAFNNAAEAALVMHVRQQSLLEYNASLRPEAQAANSGNALTYSYTGSVASPSPPFSSSATITSTVSTVANAAATEAAATLVPETAEERAEKVRKAWGGK